MKLNLVSLSSLSGTHEDVVFDTSIGLPEPKHDHTGISNVFGASAGHNYTSEFFAEAADIVIPLTGKEEADILSFNMFDWTRKKGLNPIRTEENESPIHHEKSVTVV